jgi:flavodoxin
MKAAVASVSVSHGTTARVATVIAEELDAAVLEPEAAAPMLDRCDLLGVGSGIFAMAFHPRPCRSCGRPAQRPVRREGVRVLDERDERAPVVVVGHRLNERLAAKGYEVVGSFSCRGWDTWRPLRVVGGINKRRPDQADLDKARAFAGGLREPFDDRRAASRGSTWPLENPEHTTRAAIVSGVYRTDLG